MFESEGISLFLDYKEEDFASEKDKVLTSYTFIDSPIIGDDGYYQFPVSSFDYKDYSFKVSPKYPYYEGTEEYSCKSFTMVGFDEVNKSIAYLYYYDADIDYLDDNKSTEEDRNKRMPELIETAFYWRGTSQK